MRHPKNYEPEIRGILNDSATPISDIDKLIKQVVKKSEGWWICIWIITICITLAFVGNTPSFVWNKRVAHADIVKESRPYCDSIKVRFQDLLNFKVDSLEKFSNKKK